MINGIDSINICKVCCKHNIKIDKNQFWQFSIQIALPQYHDVMRSVQETDESF